MGCLWLTILGGLAEIVGLGLAFYELFVTQRREFPERVAAHHRALRWIRRRLGLSHGQVINASSIVSGESSISGSMEVEVHRRGGDTIEQRVARMERELGDIRREHSERSAQLDHRLTETNQRLDAVEVTIRTEIDEREARRKEQLRDSLTYQKLGGALFVVGVTLSVLGATVSC